MNLLFIMVTFSYFVYFVLTYYNILFSCHCHSKSVDLSYMKQPGDYNQYFETDWEKDLTAFMKRDRNHPSVIIWSTGNEIPERGGMNNGYTLATRLVKAAHILDPSRPISNAICSYWSGLDDELSQENIKCIPSGSFLVLIM